MTELPSSLFESPLPGIRRRLTEDERIKAYNYLKILTKWQKSHRLVGSIDPEWIAENVFLHSLCFLEPLPPATHAIVDVGSGAGLPGVPMAIVRPDMEITLIESRRRRASFLSTVVRELGLVAVNVIEERVERLDASYAERFDAVVMRCAGDERSVLGEAWRLLRPGGVAVISSHPEASLPPGAEAMTVRVLPGLVRTFHRVTKR